MDLNEDAIALAKKHIASSLFSFHTESVYDLKSQPDNSFDLVICWQTLSWLDQPEQALKELVRIAKPGAKIFLSSLFNLDREVDVYSKVVDHTAKGAVKGWSYNYNTYSINSVDKWLKGIASGHRIVPFHPQIDLTFAGKGIGTHTEKMENGTRLQFSGGMLLNWGVLIITK